MISRIRTKSYIYVLALAALRLRQQCVCQNTGQALLNPDVIVTQGQDSAKAIESSFAEEVAPFDGFGDRVKLVGVNGRKVLWLKTHHPNAFKLFKIEKGDDCWEPYAQAALRFIKGFPQNASAVRPKVQGE